jgi:hypothetical protein
VSGFIPPIAPSLPLVQIKVQNHFPYIDPARLNHGLLEHRIETTSEVVSILIGYALTGLR